MAVQQATNQTLDQAGLTQREYLRALGVSYFVPRFVLPGAAPSVQAKMQERPNAAAELAPAEIVENARVDSSPEQSAAVTERPPMPSFDAPEQTLKSRAGSDANAARSSGAVTDAVSFNATLVDTGIGLLMISAAPQQGLSAEAKRLMANIARAVASHFNRRDALAFSASDFRWPVATLPGLSRLPNMVLDANAAREAFTASLLARSEKQAVRFVLLLGEELAPYLDDAMLSGQVQIVRAAAIEELMQAGTAKAALWAELRALPFSAGSGE